MTVCLESKSLHIEYTGSHRTTYLARVPVGHEVKDVLDPSYFGKLMGSDALTPGDRILIEWDDFSKFGELVVLGQVPSTNQLLTDEIVKIVGRDGPRIPEKWEVRWLGGAEFYGILYDGEMKESGFRTEELGAVRIHTLVNLDATAAATRNATKAAKPAAKAPAKKAEKEAA